MLLSCEIALLRVCVSDVVIFLSNFVNGQAHDVLCNGVFVVVHDSLVGCCSQVGPDGTCLGS